MATRSAPLRTRASPRGREHLGEGQIDRRRDLHGARIPLDDDDGTTGGFDQPGVIGGGPRLIGGAVGSQPMGGDESGDGEALRSLHRPQPSAIGSADDRLDRHIAGEGVPRVAAARPGDLLDGIRHGQGRDDCVMTGRDRRHDAAHDLGRSESASGVVHEDDEGVGPSCDRGGQAEGDAGLPGVGRPRDDLDRAADAEGADPDDLVPETVEMLRGGGDDDVINNPGGQQAACRTAHEGLPRDLDERLGFGGAQTGSGSGRGQNGDDAVGSANTTGTTRVTDLSSTIGTVRRGHERLGPQAAAPAARTSSSLDSA